MFGMGLADCRRKAEEQLKTDLAALAGSDDYKTYLPAFGDFASALFDAEAGPALGDWDTVDSYRSFLQTDLALRIIEGILPDRGVAKVRSKWSPEIAALSIEQHMESEIIWECRPDGSRVPARAEIQAAYAQHGDWEALAPKSVRWNLRFPPASADVRETIRQLLERRMFTWLDRFSSNRQAVRPDLAPNRWEFTPQHRTDFQSYGMSIRDVTKATDDEKLGLFIGYRNETIDNTIARVELRLRSDPDWTFSPSERREKQALCDDMCNHLIDAGVPVAQFKVEEEPPRFLDQLRQVRGYLEPRILALQNRTGVGIATQNDIDAGHEIGAQEINRQRDRDGTTVHERGIHGEPAVHRNRRRGRPPGHNVDVAKLQALRHKCFINPRVARGKSGSRLSRCCQD